MEIVDKNDVAGALASGLKNETKARKVKAVDPDAMTAAEKREFKKLEGYIDVHLKAGVAIGGVLKLIRDGRLYRTDYPTFENYCQKRWEITGRYANQLIEAFDTSEKFGAIAPITNYGQARAVAEAVKQHKEKIVEQALIDLNDSGTKITAKAITKAVAVEAAKHAPKPETVNVTVVKKPTTVHRVTGVTYKKDEAPAPTAVTKAEPAQAAQPAVEAAETAPVAPTNGKPPLTVHEGGKGKEGNAASRLLADQMVKLQDAIEQLAAAADLGKGQVPTATLIAFSSMIVKAQEDLYIIEGNLGTLVADQEKDEAVTA